MGIILIIMGILHATASFFTDDWNHTIIANILISAGLILNEIRSLK